MVIKIITLVTKIISFAHNYHGDQDNYIVFHIITIVIKIITLVTEIISFEHNYHGDQDNYFNDRDN